MSQNTVSRANRVTNNRRKDPKQLKPFGEGTSTTRADPTTASTEERGNERFSASVEAVDGNNIAHVQRNECRICHEDDIAENMASPCLCNGSLKFAHRECIQRWCNEKNDTICEICHQPYDGYIVADQEEPVNENEQLAAEMRIAIIRTLILVSGAIMTMKYAYDQVEVEHDGLGSIASAFASTHIFLVRLMAVVMPIYVLCWIINLVICWRRDRRERQD